MVPLKLEGSHEKEKNVGISIKSTSCTSGLQSHDAACFMTHLFIQRKCLSVEVSLRKPLDIILHWQEDLIRSYSAVSACISLWSPVEGLGFFRTAARSSIVRLSVHLQLTHAKPSSVGGSGGLTACTSAGNKAPRPFKICNYKETGDYLEVTVHFSLSD